MRYRQLGPSGLTVSVVGVGCNQFRVTVDDDGVRALVDAALETGITLFDTADIYGGFGGSEEALGNALAGRRDSAIVATKFGMDMQDGATARGSRRYIRHAVEASLRRLRTDRIDLYQFHEPDPHTPIDETLAALDELVTAGKVLYIGSSNLAGWQIVDADWTGRAAGGSRFVSTQNRYSLLERGVEAEVVPAALRCGLGLLPFYPLASGVLTGKYQRGAPAPAEARLARQPARAAQLLTDATFDILDRLAEFAARHSRRLLDVAIAGLAAQPAVSSVIAGATSAEQVRANAAAADWELTTAEVGELGSLLASG
jgi:aryl-alcohol dehydrogenase-like predicted oxidoreductase